MGRIWVLHAQKDVACLGPKPHAVCQVIKHIVTIVCANHEHGVTAALGVERGRNHERMRGITAADQLALFEKCEVFAIPSARRRERPVVLDAVLGLVLNLADLPIDLAVDRSDSVYVAA